MLKGRILRILDNEKFNRVVAVALAGVIAVAISVVVVGLATNEADKTLEEAVNVLE